MRNIAVVFSDLHMKGAKPGHIFAARLADIPKISTAKISKEAKEHVVFHHSSEHSVGFKQR